VCKPGQATKSWRLCGFQEKLFGAGQAKEL